MSSLNLYARMRDRHLSLSQTYTARASLIFTFHGFLYYLPVIIEGTLPSIASFIHFLY